jgi:hypothetical protein
MARGGRSRWLAPPALILALVVPAAPVSASPRAAADDPPDRSAVDQYRESVPGGATRRLTPGQRQRLERLGRDGRALAQLLDPASGSPAGSAAPTSPPTRRPAARPAAHATDGRAAAGAAGTAPSGAAANGAGSGVPAAERSRPGAASDALGAAAIGPLPLWAALLAMGVVALAAALARRARRG